MTDRHLTYYSKQELNSWVVDDWKDENGSVWDLSSGWTFSLALMRATAPATTLLLKTTGITATSTKVTVAWAVDEFNGLENSLNGTQYVVALSATRVSDSRTLYYHSEKLPTLTLKTSPGDSATSPSSYPITVTAASVTLVDAAGNYITSDVEAAFTEQARYNRTPAKGSVCFVFDDGYPSWASVVLPALNTGQRCTFMVTTGQIGSGTGVSAATLNAIVAAGHELGAHSTAHQNYTSLTAAQRATDHDSVVATLEGYAGVGKIRSFAYPLGARNSTTDRECLHRYDRIFTIGSPHWKPSALDLPGQFVYGRINWGFSDGQGHTRVLDLIRLAQRQPINAVIYCHDPSNTTGSFPTDPSAANVAEAFNLCKTLGVPMLTVSEAINGAPYGLTNGGFESGLSEWSVTNSGGYTVEVVTDTPAVGLPGTKSLHFLTSGATTCFVEQLIPVVPGQPFNLSYQYKFISGTGHTHIVQEYNYDGTAGTTTSSGLLAAGAGAWTAQNRDIAALGTNTVAVGIKFIVQAANEFYIDHVHAGYQAWGKFG